MDLITVPPDAQPEYWVCGPISDRLRLWLGVRDPDRQSRRWEWKELEALLDRATRHGDVVPAGVVTSKILHLPQPHHDLVVKAQQTALEAWALPDSNAAKLDLMSSAIALIRAALDLPDSPVTPEMRRIAQCGPASDPDVVALRLEIEQADRHTAEGLGEVQAHVDQLASVVEAATKAEEVAAEIERDMATSADETGRVAELDEQPSVLAARLRAELAAQRAVAHGELV